MNITDSLIDSWTLAFVAMLVANTAVRLWLASRQIRHVYAHRLAVPAEFADRIGQEAHARAAAYTIARTRLGMFETLLGAAVLVGFTLLGGLQWLMDAAAALLPQSPMAAQVLFVAFVFIVSSLVDLPLEIWRRFRIEAAFGFNRMTLRLFLVDTAKGWLLATLIGLPMCWLVLALMRWSGSAWWLWVWFAWVAFTLAAMVVFPIFVAPLFNRFEPLPGGELRNRVEALLARCGFAARGLFVMDGSRRSAHGNAYFTGIGRARRIVFFDTLIERLHPAEVEAVLAHELGHFRLHHVPLRIGLMLALGLAGLALLGWLSSQPVFYASLGLIPAPGMRDAAALVLFMMVTPVFTFVLQPFFSLLSRRHEFQADAFAAAHARADDLVSALVKLYRDNASTLTPDPLHSAFHDSHPPAVQRIERLMSATS